MSNPSASDEPQARRDPPSLEPAETASYEASLSDRTVESQESYRERFPEIEGYRVQRIIGRGGMGVVYKAIQEKLSRPVALKLLPAVVSSAHPELITRFRREAAAAAKLHHTNIIPIYDFGESQDGYYYAMELIDGQPLSVLIKRLSEAGAPHISHTVVAALLHEDGLEQWVRGGAPEGDGSTAVFPGSATGGKERAYYRQVARWTADVAEALHYAHIRGMIHRDVKPSNLMLCLDGRMMILDFGLVKTTGDQSVTATGSLVGSYRYMSPEQVGAKRIHVDARSDVYSLGATLYELLTFQPAFGGVDQSDLLSEILFKEPTPPRKVVPSVPTDLQTICLKAMEKSPGERYRTAQEMADDLNRYLQDMAIVARPQGLARRTIKLVRRRRMETIAIVSLVLIAIASVVAVRFYQHQREAQRQAEVAREMAAKEAEAARQAATARAVDQLAERGVAAWQQGDWEAAAEAFSRLLKFRPDDYPTLVNLASVYSNQYDAERDQGLLADANELLERAIQVRPEGGEAWNVRGVVYQQWGRVADAITAYEKVRSINPAYYAVWVNLGMLHAAQGELEEAEECLLEGTRLPAVQADVMPWRVLAAVQLQLGRDGVLEVLDRARQIEPTDIPTLVLYATYYLRSGEEEDAARALEFAAAAHTLIGTQESETERAGTANQDVIRVKRTLALARLRNRQWAGALSAAEEALAVGDQEAFPHAILAVAKARQGQQEAARSHLSRAEEAWPGALREAAYQVTDDGRSLWFDTAAQLRSLCDEALVLVEASAEQGG
ncbi:MAG: protein kinase [Phycisphaerales bacterium]|nr:MAG: protein kinase [Phycisphaerales bacterium]